MSRPPYQVFDPGLQPERTALAWRRTVLSVGVGALVAIRILPPELGVFALLLGGSGVVVAGAIWVLAGRRGAATHRGLHDVGTDLPDGRLPLALAALVSAGAVVGLVFALTQ